MTSAASSDLAAGQRLRFRPSFSGTGQHMRSAARHDEVASALVAISRWLAEEQDEAGDWPALARSNRRGRVRLATVRSCCRFARFSQRSRRQVTTPAETAQATTAILESGAIMLGAALVFVTLFRRLKLGATLGYIVAGASIGPQILGLIRDPAAADKRHRNRHSAAPVHRRPRTPAEPVMEAAQGHFRPRPGPGDPLRTRVSA